MSIVDRCIMEVIINLELAKLLPANKSAMARLVKTILLARADFYDAIFGEIGFDDLT